MTTFQRGDVVRVIQYEESHVIDTKCRTHEISGIPLVGAVGEVLHVIPDEGMENLSVRINNLFPGKESSKLLLWSTEVELVYRPVPKEQMALIEEAQP